MRVILDRYQGERPARLLGVVLPGAMQHPEDLLGAGFTAAVRERGLPMDLALVDFNMDFIGEAGNGTLVRRLHDTLMQHASEVQGYDEIWLAGISIGGAMAAAYVDTYGVAGPCPIRGLCLLAPYPGNRLVTRAIREAGGVAHWSPEHAGDMDEGAVGLWRWLKNHRHNSDHNNHNSGTRLYLGFGLQDRFAEGLALMADAVEASCVDTVPGGHDLAVWQVLWNRFLDRLAAQVLQTGERL
jgi:pimeloyl-ACP methyl ester carboxylesterase